MATITGPASLHPDQVSHRYAVFLGVAGMMTLLATVSVILRFASRKLTLYWYWDDWAILGALVFSYGFLTTTALVATVGGAGYPVNQYSLLQLEKYLQASDDIIYSMFKPGTIHVLTYIFRSRSLSPTMSSTMLVLPYRRPRSYSYTVVSLRWTGRSYFGRVSWVASSWDTSWPPSLVSYLRIVPWRLSGRFGFLTPP